MTSDIILFCERKKWHGRSVSRALKARGIAPLAVPLAECGFSTGTRTGLAIPGLGDHLPRGALVLFVPGGSFEQVTVYLGVLHALRELGVKVTCLHEGSVLAEGTIDQVSSNERVIEVYLGR